MIPQTLPPLRTPPLTALQTTPLPEDPPRLRRPPPLVDAVLGFIQPGILDFLHKMDYNLLVYLDMLDL